MLQHDSDIVEYPLAKGAWKRIRLQRWPRTKGITENAFARLKELGLIRSRRWHPGSRSFPQWTLTVRGMKEAAK